MAKFITQNVVCLIFLVLVAICGAQTPPGIAKNPSHATCKNEKYKDCYNLVHVCPKFCPDSCTVECASCKPICGGPTLPPPDSKSPTPSPSPKPSSPTPRTPYPTPSPATPSTPKPTPPTPTPKPATPPTLKPTPPTPTPKPPTPAPVTPSPAPKPSSPNPKPPTPAPRPSSPTPKPPTPAPRPSSPTPKPPTQTPSSPKPTPPTPVPASPSTPTPSSPTPSPSTHVPSTPTPNTPSTPTPTPPSSSTPAPHSPYPTTPSTPTTTVPSPPSPTPDSESSASSARAKCKNQNYPQCYNVQHVCPTACPGGCEVDCVTCKPVCNCDKPGAVCQDPRFVGGDGITFYFHGKKEQDFCLVTDSNLHINAHFIGKRNKNMKRDFTWVQSIAIFFDTHNFFISAQKTATWDATINHLELSFDGESIHIPETEGAIWKSETIPKASITRIGNTDNVIIEVQSIFKITAKVVPITKHESVAHNYGITEDNCFAHLNLGFKFYSLSDQVSGVLGQTYRDDYVSRVHMGASMPVLGGDKEFATSSLFATDCSVALFKASHSNEIAASSSLLQLPSLQCSSNMNGKGVICKR
ncbi:Late embryogenesis abundant protein-related / LEA protein-related protein [Heracleum sosnowskyi]|uniref:Late embryogenesis abundant protein-related / LEA protein-related protein n=1 Tax=Heracleum sosnowskyi TaxID=360622 RepID=A0AAD8MR14_9APIA|nr:Late embryogenesis abundant protein-related / LEA protein-related protein [Heracleum sosnowskyi]